MRRRVILLGDERKEGVRPAVERVRSWIGEHADLVAVDLDGTLDLREARADLLVIFGGDGSILAAARRMGDRPIPTVGVNFGKFGFMTDIRSRDVAEELPRVLRGECVVEDRLVLVGRVLGDDRDGGLLALNEFFLGPAAVGRIISIELFLDGQYATTYRGDGLLVATPTGSTGHSLSAGGPIVEAQHEAVLLTPVSPHSLTNRPLVVPPGARVELRPLRDHTRTSATLTVDGQVRVRLGVGQALVITRAEHRFPLVRTGLRSAYDVLRTRLGWSGQPPAEAEEGEFR